MEQIDDSIRKLKKLVGRITLLRNQISLLADFASKILYIGIFLHENHLRDQQMEKFLLNFGVHQYFIRYADKDLLFVDVSQKPFLRDQRVNHAERNHILPLELRSRADAFLVSLFVPDL